MQALSQLSYGPTEGREFWGTRPDKSNQTEKVVTGKRTPGRYSAHQ